MMRRRLNMGMRGRRDATTTTATANPVQILSSYDPMVETSVINQDTTSYKIKTTGIISHNPTTTTRGRRNAFATQPGFGVIATILIYSPGHGGPISAYDFSGAQPNGTPAERRSYSKLYQLKFGNGFQLASFLLNGVGPMSGTQTLVFKHPPCRRRAVLADQIVNVQGPDKQAVNTGNGRKSGQISTGASEETSTALELVYGVVAIGGTYSQYIAPADFLPINLAESKIDDFDVSLRTYYKLTSTAGSYRVGATGVGQFQWAAGIQTFKALTV